MWIDLDHISFAEWLVELNACAVKARYKGPPLTEITGQICWHPHYEEGLAPNTALELAAKEGTEFGQDYMEEISS